MKVRWGCALLVILLGACVKPTPMPPIDNSKFYELEYTLNTATPSLLNMIDKQQSSALINYVEEVLTANPSIEAMAATVEAYKHASDVVAGEQLPHIDINIDAQKEKLATQEGQTTLVQAFTFSRSVSWSVDIWGKVADEHQAALLTVEQQQNHLLWARRLLVAEAIETWIEYWTLNQQVWHLETANGIQNRLSTSSYEAYQNGLITYKDYLLQKNAEMSHLIELGNSRLEKTKARYRLNILRGESPNSEIEDAASISTDLIVAIPEHVSALALVNRPDIRKAFNDIQILDMETSAAYKALLPQLNLNGSLFKTGSAVDHAFDQSLLWRLVGGITQPIFHGGSLKAKAEQKSQEAKSAWWQYQHVVLQALIEVENSLSQEQTLYQDIQQTQSVLDNQNKIKRTNADLYLQGEIGIDAFLQSKIMALAAKQDLASKQSDYLKNRVSFALALGEPLENITGINDEQ